MTDRYPWRLGERSCPTCDATVTINARNPHRRYCSTRCRAAAYRHRRRLRDLDTADGAANGVTNAVPTNAVTTNAVPAQNAVPAANGVQHCPHCRQPLAVIAVVVPADAAHIRIPEVIHTSPT